MKEPLKSRLIESSSKEYDVVQAKYLKSALEWMIRAHEERIDNAIKAINELDYTDEHDVIMETMAIVSIQLEYDAIQILEAGLEDIVLWSNKEVEELKE